MNLCEKMWVKKWSTNSVSYGQHPSKGDAKNEKLTLFILKIY
jgi:hypothetical protein